MKKRWAILTWPPQFDMSIQVQVPPALVALHNFIMDHDPQDVDEYLAGNETDLDPIPGQPHGFGDLAAGVVSRTEKTRATTLRDQIAERMWTNYQITSILGERSA